MDELVQTTLYAECACSKANTLDLLLEATDEAVAKALATSEIARIARLELRSRDMLTIKWAIRSEQAATTAGKMVANGSTLTAALKTADKVMAKWEGDVSGPYARNLANAYRLARIAGHKRGTGKSKASLQYTITERPVEKAKDPSANVRFDLVDEKAIDSLARQELLWIGGVHEGVAPVIREAVKPSVLAGLSKEDAGKMVADAVARSLKGVDIPDGYKGSAASYFQGLAANAVTNARVQGQLTSFARLNITRYEIVNPMDDRTTLICREMNGQVFYVKDGMDQLAEIQAAKTPEQYKSAHPWLSTASVKNALSKGYGATVKAGLCFPPYHFECRSTVDISESSTTLDGNDETG